MANPRKLRVEVVTAERVVLTAEDVDLVSAPGSEGRLGILPQHSALFTLLSAGELRIRKGMEEEEIVVFGGFLEVLNNRVLILADSAERIEEIDVERAEAARRRAEEALATGSAVEIEVALAALRRSRVRIRAAGRRGRRGVAPTGTTPQS
jgi:F-type H+-transporting ATPase subunit epsilon